MTTRRGFLLLLNMSNTTTLTDFQKGALQCRNCLRCSKPIPPKDKRTTWEAYQKQKYCSDECGARSLDLKPLDDTEGITDGLPLSKYVMQRTMNGRLMADWYIRVLEVLKDKKLKKSQHCLNCHVGMVNGVRITDESVKNAMKWLTDNAFGKPGVRNEDGSDINDLDEHKKFLEKYILQDLEPNEVEELEKTKKLNRELLKENASLRDEIHRLMTKATGEESQAFEDTVHEIAGNGKKEVFKFSTSRLEER